MSQSDQFPRFPYHILDAEDCFEKLDLGRNFDVRQGLSKREAERRLARYGLNQLSRKQSNVFEKIYRQLSNKLALIFMALVVISALRAITATATDACIRNWINAGVFITYILSNTRFGIWQERKAEEAAEALHSPFSAKVIRDGQQQKIPSNKVVPGDIVFLGLGDHVPADMRCLQVANLQCQEAALTGESLLVDKQIAPLSCENPEDAEHMPLGDRVNLCFGATYVTQGRGMGVAIYTGDRTESGLINAPVNKVERNKTDVLEQTDHISKWLALFMVLTAIVTMLVAIFLTGLNPLDAFTVALTCALAMTPQSLDVNLTYAWAVMNMGKHNAIIRALPAIDTLGIITVICSDKTIMDPSKPECVQAIKDAHEAGIRVAMITGDNEDTAQTIGRMLGIVSPEYPGAVTGVELDEMTEDQLRLAVMTNNVFARATPENKIQIVKALQSEGQICSMTGDRINDAPALKTANMGVAMGLEVTDVAREASEMILEDDNFATIVYAVREGRRVWDNAHKVLLAIIPICMAQGLSLLFGIGGLQKLILTPFQVYICNSVCACLAGFLGLESAEKGIMLKPPRRVGKRLVTHSLLLRMAFATMTLVTCTVAAVFIANSIKDYPIGMQRSLANNTLTFSACSVAMSARFAHISAVHPRVFMGNKAIIYCVLCIVVFQLFITYTPGVNIILSMDGQDGLQWIIVIVCVFITFFVMEGEKALRRCLKAHRADTDNNLRDEMHLSHPSRVSIIRN